MSDESQTLADLRIRCATCQMLVVVNSRNEVTPHLSLLEGRGWCPGSRRSPEAHERARATGIPLEEYRIRSRDWSKTGAWIICPWCKQKVTVVQKAYGKAGKIRARIGGHRHPKDPSLVCEGWQKPAYDRLRFDDPPLDPEVLPYEPGGVEPPEDYEDS